MNILVKKSVIICIFILSIMDNASIAKNNKDWNISPRTLSLSGEIISPSNGSVNRSFLVNATIKGKYHNIWLMKKIGDLYWPNEIKLDKLSGQWKNEVTEYGRPPDGKIELLLLDTSDEINKLFLQWFKEGERSHSYPGLNEDKIKSINILDRKEYYLSE
jgi:hypothetical protein